MIESKTVRRNDGTHKSDQKTQSLYTKDRTEKKKVQDSEKEKIRESYKERTCQGRKTHLSWKCLYRQGSE